MENLNNQFQNQTTYYKFSSFVKRFLAFTLDGVLALSLAAILMLIFGKKLNIQNVAELILLIYNMIFIYLYGATLGKMLFHIKVVSTSYQKLTFIQVLKREILGKPISTLFAGLGFIWAAFDDKKQAWHDKIAKTYVIDTQPITYEQYLELQKDQRSDLPTVLIIAGLLEPMLPLISVFFVLPKLTALYAQMQNNIYNPYLIYGPITIMVVISIAQVVYGVVLASSQKKLGTLSASQKNLGKILVIAGIISATVMIPVLVIAIILPIYKLTTSL